MVSRPVLAIAGTVTGLVALVGTLGAVGATSAPRSAEPARLSTVPPAPTVTPVAVSGSNGRLTAGRLEFRCPGALHGEAQTSAAQRVFTTYMACSGAKVPGRSETASSLVLFGDVPRVSQIPGGTREETAREMAEDVARRLGYGIVRVENMTTSEVNLGGVPAVRAQADVVSDDMGERTDHVEFWLFTVDGVDFGLFSRASEGSSPAELAAVAGVPAMVRIS